jgi:hypothetical protein
MPRTVSTTFRHSTQASFADDVDLIFATISHSELATPIRVVNDTVDYSYNSFSWIGFPFDITILGDDESPPQAKIELQNVDQVIGQAVRDLSGAPRLKLELLSSADFNLDVRPRVPIGSPFVQYIADRLYLSNVSVDVLTISAQIVGWDYLQRTWPGIRATQSRLPGLFR